MGRASAEGGLLLLRHRPSVASVEPPALIPLSQAAEGQRVRLVALPSHPTLRRRLTAMGLRPGTPLEVIRRGHPGGLLHLAHGVLEFMLRQEHAALLEVEPQEVPGSRSGGPG